MRVKIPTITGPRTTDPIYGLHMPRTIPIMELRGFEAGHHRHLAWQVYISKQRELQRVIDHLR